MSRYGLLLALLTAGWAAADETAAPVPVIALNERVTIGAGDVTLGQIADLSRAGDAREQLAAIGLGQAPPPGQSRTIIAGYIRLRLRRSRLDPDGFAWQGASTTLVREQSAAAPARAEVETDPTAQPPRPAIPPCVRRNAAVAVQVRCGGVTVVLTGRAGGDGQSGDAIPVHLAATNRTVMATVIDQGLVRIEL